MNNNNTTGRDTMHCVSTAPTFLAIIFALAFTLFACSDDSDDDGTTGGVSSSSEAAIPSSSDGTALSENSSSSGGVVSSSSKGSLSSSSKASNSSSSGVGSSSSVKASSSSSARSSSSRTPRSSSSWKLPLNSEITYDTLVDTRDGQIYSTLQVTDRFSKATITVMAQNLNVGTMVTGGSGQNNDAVLEKYCYNNDPENCIIYGGLYQWSEAMGLPSSCNTTSCAHLIADTNSHQGLCPDGWRVLTRADFWIVINGSEDGSKGVRSSRFGGLNTSGYTLLGGGGYMDFMGGFADLGKRTWWNYPYEHITKPATDIMDGVMNNQSTSMVSSGGPKTDGRSLRCVKVE